MLVTLGARMSASTHRFRVTRLGIIPQICKGKQTMGKGNNSQKNDKKNKKVKKDSKAQQSKPADKKR